MTENHLAPPLKRRVITRDGLVCKLTAYASEPSEEQLADRPGHMLISIKNRAFSDKLIGRWCALAGKAHPKAYVTIVDEPYIHNIAAQTDDPAERTRREERLFQLADERVRQVTRILRRPGNENAELVYWKDLAADVPSWMTAEVDEAYRAGGEFTRAVQAHCRATIADYDNAVSPDAFELFFVEEAPVLLYAYYLLGDGVIDAYPGPQPGVLWRIEQGVFEKEMPRTTAAARTHRGLLYNDLAIDEEAGDSGK